MSILWLVAKALHLLLEPQTQEKSPSKNVPLDRGGDKPLSYRKKVCDQPVCYQVLSFKIRTYCIGTNNEHVQIKQTAVTRFKQWAQGGKARLIFNLGSHQIYTSPHKFMWSLFHYFMCHFPISAVTRENWFSGFPTRSDTNWSVQSQKKARLSKFWI